ncbi:MAG TPA: redoxin domain-containing protein [Pyrinomonadaceae bacterium]|jgi:thiol-disulfide isomerase/thioredoxin
MRYSFYLLPGLAMLALSLTPAGQPQHARSASAAAAAAAPLIHRPAATLVAFNPLKGAAQEVVTGKTGQAHKTKKGETATRVAVVREIDLEALKKLLQRGTGTDARPLLVNFWATWCVPCREEFPDLVKINSDYAKRNLEVITISLDDPSEIKTTVPQFLREVRAGNLPAYLLNVIDPDIAINTIDPQWRGALPATFLYDASGQMVFKHTGRFDTRELRAAIDKVTTAR